MPRIRRRLKRMLPTNVVASPVVSAIVLVGHILLDRHRIACRRPRRSIIRQSRIRRNPSSRNDSEFLIFQEGDDGFNSLRKIFRFRASSVRGRRLNILDLQVRSIATREIVINRVRHGSIIGSCNADVASDNPGYHPVKHLVQDKCELVSVNTNRLIRLPEWRGYLFQLESIYPCVKEQAL